MSQACCVTARGGNLHQARLPAGRFTTEDVHSNTSIFPPRISRFLSALRFLFFSISRDRKCLGFFSSVLPILLFCTMGHVLKMT